jgi:pSer/pThr/pTyr-binding forkhead associated (FHA) protein
MTPAIVEVLDRDGRVRQVVRVTAWPVTIGRGVACDVVLDDPHVASHHLTVREADGAIAVQVGETLNGVRVGRRRLAAHETGTLAAGMPLALGHTQVRIRRAGDPLPAERRLTADGPGRPVLVTLALCSALAAWSLAEYWLGADPGRPFTEYLGAPLGVLLLLSVWAAVWAVGSRLVQHRFEYAAHLRIACGLMLLTSVVMRLLPLASYATGAVAFSRMTDTVGAALAWVMVFLHVRRVWPTRPRVLAAVMAGLFLTGLGLYLTRTYQLHGRLSDQLYVSTLGPPALRVASAVTSDRFLQEARVLEPFLQRRAAEGEADEADTTGE